MEDLGATADFYQRSIVKSVPAKLPVLDSYSSILFDDYLAYKEFIKLLTASKKDIRALVGKKILAGNQSVANHLATQGLLVDEVVTTTKLSDDVLEVGGQNSSYSHKEFLSLYQRKEQTHELPFDLEEFNAVIFPSTASLRDFKSTLNEEQFKQLKDLTAFVMGQSIYDLATQNGFKKVINCQPNIKATIEQVKKELASE